MQSLKNNNGILEMPKEPKYEPNPQGIAVHCFNKMKEFSNRIAQIDFETNKSDTYGEILMNSIRVAIKMQTLGVTDEDVISLCTGIHRQTCLPFWGALFMGAKSANIDPSISLSDMKYLINLTKPKLIFCVPESVANLETTIKELNLGTKLVVFFDKNTCHIPFEEFVKPQAGENEFKPKIAKSVFDTFLIVFSSGTTGFSKGVCLSHYAMLYTINVLSDSFDFKSVLYFTSPYWISYSIFIATTLLAGGSRTICKFDDKTILKTIQDYKVTFLFLPPSLTYSITSTENMQSNFDTSSLTSMMTGGACIGTKQLEKLRKLLKNVSVHQIYGLTETAGVFALFNKKYELELLSTKKTSCGRMTADTICKIVDVETKEIVGPNKPGELLIKSKRLMNGYYNDPQGTADVFDEDGFLHTGDIVYYDEDYCFYIVDRIKEMFKYRSWQIIPAELENILLNNPAVKEAMVIGYPNEEDGDHPMAVIVQNNEFNITADDILEYFNNQVSDRKKLRGGVKFVKTLPRTPTGKYSRRILRNMIIKNEI